MSDPAQEEPAEIVVTGVRVYDHNTIPQDTGGGGFFFTMSTGGMFSQDDVWAAVLNGQYQIFTEPPPPPTDEGEIVVQATEAQVNAAKAAYAGAELNLNIIQIMAVIGGALIHKWGAAVVAGVEKVVDINSEEVVAFYADLLYKQDAMDGAIDGYAHNANQFEGFDFRGLDGPSYYRYHHEPQLYQQ